MKKLSKVLCSLVACAMFVTPVMATNSQTANGDVIGGTVDGQPLPEGQEVTFTNDFSDVKEEAVTEIKSIESGEKIGATITVDEKNNPDAVNLSEMVALSTVKDLSILDENGNKVTDAKNVTVTWTEPKLTHANVYVLHFSTVRNVWEVITPEVDVEKQTVTATFPDLSPVVVIAKPDSANNGGQTTTTGDSNNVALYVGIAAVSIAVLGAVVVSKKKKASF